MGHRGMGCDGWQPPGALLQAHEGGTEAVGSRAVAIPACEPGNYTRDSDRVTESPMEWIGEIWRRLRALVRRRQNDRDLEEEMRLHVELRAEEQIQAGVAPPEAHRTAHRRFGNTLLIKESSRDVWGWHPLEILL